MATTQSQSLLTVEQYALIPDSGRPTELVRGKIIEMNMPFPQHGQVCANVTHILKSIMDDNDLGRTLSNDAGVVTERGPDTVRGADVAFYSFARLPRGPLLNRYLDIPPDIVFEVRSPSDRWGQVTAKVAEYLNAGVRAVCVLDPATETAYISRSDQPPQTLSRDDELLLPELADTFRVPVRRFFE